MKPLFTTDEFDKAKSTDYLMLECHVCHQPFSKLKRVIKRLNKVKYHASKYCSPICMGQDYNRHQDLNCANCDKPIRKLLSQIGKRPFCSRSCAATYNNLHKTTGSRRSKLEVWLETKLSAAYPTLPIKYCDKTAINSELDIYLPTMNLAIELNGIYHYEPIHGQGKLDQITSNDNRKFQACLESKIELVIIYVSSLKYFKEHNCLKYFEIIKNIIDTKFARMAAIEAAA